MSLRYNHRREKFRCSMQSAALLTPETGTLHNFRRRDILTQRRLLEYWRDR